MSKPEIKTAFPAFCLAGPQLNQALLRTRKMVDRANDAADAIDSSFRAWKNQAETRKAFDKLRLKLNRIHEVMSHIAEISVKNKEDMGAMVSYNYKVADYFHALGDMIAGLNDERLSLGRDLYTTINKLFNTKRSKLFLYRLLERVAEQFNRAVAENGNPAGWNVNGLTKEERPRCPLHSFWTRGFVPQ